MTCHRCHQPGAHLLAGDCVRALLRRVQALTATNERLRLRLDAERSAGSANRREVSSWRRLHRRAMEEAA